MEKKLFTKSMLLSATIIATMIVIMNVGIVLATPPYYKGPFKGFEQSEDEFIEVAMIGYYDYENPPVKPYPCVLHQGYGYALGDWDLYGNLHMEYIAWDQADNTLYDSSIDGSPGYAYYYAYPASPYADSSGTVAHQYYWNTATSQIENPPAAAVLVMV